MPKAANSREKKIIPADRLRRLREENANAKIVQCHGVFDVLHAGHLAYLESAKKFGDLLVVTITADRFVNKGPGRPYFNSGIRANMLAALEVVDFVYVNDNPTATSCIELLKPHFYVKGPDYDDKTKDPTGAIYEEERAAEAHGGKLVFTRDETFSSSFLINNYFPAWNDSQQAAIEAVKAAGGLSAIEECLARIAKMNVAVVGEPIVDTYVFCRPENISSKSPCLSAKYLYQEDYAGGTLAIANHLSDFVGGVQLVTTHGGEEWFRVLLEEKLDRRVTLHEEVLSGVPTPRKTRYIADDKVQRLFELTNLTSDQWQHHSPKGFLEKMRKAAGSCDFSVVADFGHGQIEGEVLKAVPSISDFLALNVQTNSSNFGFNPYTKHKSFSYLSIDLKEARLAFQDRLAAHLELARRVKHGGSAQQAAVSMTLGPMGAFYLPREGGKEIQVAAFADGVVDAVGAGDAYFSISSLLVKAGAPDVFVPFVGNVFAGLKTKIIGNKNPVRKAQLLKALTAILK